jgi:hypothetical protein
MATGGLDYGLCCNPHCKTSPVVPGHTLATRWPNIDNHKPFNKESSSFSACPFNSLEVVQGCVLHEPTECDSRHKPLATGDRFQEKVAATPGAPRSCPGTPAAKREGAAYEIQDLTPTEQIEFQDRSAYFAPPGSRSLRSKGHLRNLPRPLASGLVEPSWQGHCQILIE